MSHDPTPTPEMPHEEEDMITMMHRRMGLPLPDPDDED